MQHNDEEKVEEEEEALSTIIVARENYICHTLTLWICSKFPFSDLSFPFY